MSRTIYTHIPSLCGIGLAAFLSFLLNSTPQFLLIISYFDTSTSSEGREKTQQLLRLTVPIDPWLISWRSEVFVCSRRTCSFANRKQLWFVEDWEALASRVAWQNLETWKGEKVCVSFEFWLGPKWWLRTSDRSLEDYGKFLVNRKDIYSNSKKMRGVQLHGASKNSVLRYYHSSCPHCWYFAPVFRQIAAAYQGSSSSLHVAACNCAAEDNFSNCSCIVQQIQLFELAGQVLNTVRSYFGVVDKLVIKSTHSFSKSCLVLRPRNVF